MSAIFHNPGYIYLLSSTDMSKFSPSAFKHSIEIGPIGGGSLLEDEFGRKVLRAFNRLLGSSTLASAMGLLAIDQTKARLIFKNEADAGFLLAATSAPGLRTRILEGVWTHATKYPQERLGIQFLVAMPNNMAMIDRARKIYDKLSECGDLGYLLWKPTIDTRSPEEKDSDVDEAERLREEADDDHGDNQVERLEPMEFTAYFYTNDGHHAALAILQRKHRRAIRARHVKTVLHGRFSQLNVVEKPRARPMQVQAPTSERRTRRKIKGLGGSGKSEATTTYRAALEKMFPETSAGEFDSDGYEILPWIDDWLAAMEDEDLEGFHHWTEVVEMEKRKALKRSKGSDGGDAKKQRT